MIRSDDRSSIHKHYILYVELGLVFALILLITAARVRLAPGERDFQVHLQAQEVVDMEEITQTEQQMEAPPPPKAPVPVEVPDNTVVEQEEVDFDASLDLSTSLDTTMGPPGPNESTATTNDENPEDEIFVAVEQQPKLIGGMQAVREAIDYPDLAEKTGIEGRVFVEFVVDKEGNVQNPTVVRGVHELLDKEALRVAKKMKFHPGKQRGDPVKVRFTLPVTFKLKEGRPPQ
jgi:protein TonB